MVTEVGRNTMPAFKLRPDSDPFTHGLHILEGEAFCFTTAPASTAFTYGLIILENYSIIYLDIM